MTGLAVMRAGNLDSLIPTDAQKVVSSGWLTNLAVMRVGLMVVWILTDAELVRSSGW